MRGRQRMVAISSAKTHFGAGTFGRCCRFALARAPRESRKMAGIFGRWRGQGSGQGAGEAANEAKPQDAAGTVVRDATTASFGAEVIADSARQPVLVDFWAPWCEPCKQLAPLLEKIVKAAGGKVKLVRMNIDDHPEIPGRLGVRSIPAVIAFQKQQPVDGFVGALPESQVRGFIERLVGPLGGGDLLAEAEAEDAATKGDAAGAAEIYAEILEAAPGDPKAVAGLARL